MKTLPILIISLILILSASCGDPNLPPSASMKARDLTVTKSEVIELEEGILYSLSPNGKWFVVLKGNFLSIYNSETKEEICTTEDIKEMGPIDISSLRWSPDGRYLVFSIDFFRMYQESDLWLIDTDSASVTNITDDGKSPLDFSLFKVSADDPVPIDVVPFWSEDGKTIYFYRYLPTKRRGGWSGYLYSLDIEKKEPKKEFLIPMESPFAVWNVMLHTNDYFFYPYQANQSSHKSNGLWRISPKGENREKIYESHPEWGTPVLVQQSRNGEWGIFAFQQAISNDPNDMRRNVSYNYLINLKNNNTKPVKAAPSDDPLFSMQNKAVFSPGGSKVLYTYYDIKRSTYILAVKDIDGEEERILYESPDPLAVSLGYIYNGNDHSLIWTEEDRIFVKIGGGVIIFDIGKD